jgi:hypothetical protein
MELKLRSAARLSVFVSKNELAEMETTLNRAYIQPLGERSERSDTCQMSLVQRRESRVPKPLSGISVGQTFSR